MYCFFKFFLGTFSLIMMLIYLMEGGDDDDDDEDVRWLSYACHMVIIIRIICRPMSGTVIIIWNKQVKQKIQQLVLLNWAIWSNDFQLNKDWPKCPSLSALITLLKTCRSFWIGMNQRYQFSGSSSGTRWMKKLVFEDP